MIDLEVAGSGLVHCHSPPCANFCYHLLETSVNEIAITCSFLTQYYMLFMYITSTKGVEHQHARDLSALLRKRTSMTKKTQVSSAPFKSVISMLGNISNSSTTSGVSILARNYSMRCIIEYPRNYCRSYVEVHTNFRVMQEFKKLKI